MRKYWHGCKGEISGMRNLQDGKGEITDGQRQ